MTKTRCLSPYRRIASWTPRNVVRLAGMVEVEPDKKYVGAFQQSAHVLHHHSGQAKECGAFSDGAAWICEWLALKYPIFLYQLNAEG